MKGFHKQMDNRIKLLEEILSFRMQGVEFDNGDMYVDGHKAASDVRDEFVSVTEKLMDELAQCYNVLPQLDINNTIDHLLEFFFSSRRRHTRSLCDWSSDVCSSDLATGKVTEWPSPSGPKSQPYGIVFTKGALWYNESFAKPNTIVRFDPQTEKFQTWAIPGGGDIVRNMDVTPDGNVVTANSLVNQVGLVEIK